MRFRRALRPLALTLAACVLLTGGWAAFMLTDPFAGHRQEALQQQLHHSWRASPVGDRAGGGDTPRSRPGAAGGPGPGAGQPGLVTGQPFALIRVPAFGPTWKFAIVQGTALPQLALGPGHVPGTGLPGQRGNFAVAAHDITAGNPFRHLATLRKPDKVYVYTRTHRYEYAVQSERVVRYTNVSVEAPVPGHPGQAPGRPRITLITCTPVTLQFTPWRIVVTGQLVATVAWHAA
jgi:sortase A